MYIEVLREFRKRFRRKRPELFESGQWHFHQDNAPVHNSILVTDYLTQTGIKTVPHPPYSPDLAPSNFWIFPKLKENLRGNRYSTIEDMKEAVTRVLNTLTQEDFQGAFQKLLERYNKCIDVVVVVYPTPSERWGHGGRPWSPRSRATPQGLDQRS